MDVDYGKIIRTGAGVIGLLVLGSLVGFAQAPEKDSGKLMKQVREKLQKGDYDWLETTAETLRQGPFDLLETMLPIGYFYYAFGENLSTEAASEKRLAELLAWQAAKPDSLTARTALGEFYVGYAWRARGSGWASSVSSEGWRQFRNRLAQSAGYLYNEWPKPEAPWRKWIKPLRRLMAGSLQIPVNLGLYWLPLENVLNSKARNLAGVNDPANMASRIVVAMGQSDPEAMRAAFKAGTETYPTYFPIYERQQRFLLPRWFGEPGEGARAAAKNADQFEGPQSDAFYVRLAEGVLSAEKEDFFEESGFDIDRMLRGYDYLIATRDAYWPPYYQNRAAFVAASAGQWEEARRRTLEVGPLFFPDAWLGRDNLNQMLKEMKIAEAVQPGETLEAAGKLAEAQAFYRALSPGKSTNEWLKLFAMRNNLPELYASFPKTADPTQRIEKHSLDQIHELMGFYFASGDFVKLREFAKFFDSKRPQNFTGKSALYFIAALEGDAEGMAAARQALLGYKTDRFNYQIAVKYMKGEIGWAEAIKELKEDGHRLLSLSTMSAHALAEGKADESRQILAVLREQYPLSIESTAANSLHYGALYRNYNPWKLP